MEVQKLSGEQINLYHNLSPDEKVETLFRKYYSPLCKSLYRILKDVSLAEDIVQEVFLKVWDKRNQLQLDEAVHGYLYRSCYNTALNFLKSKKPHEDISAGYDIPAGGQNAEEALRYLETESQILLAIEDLPAKTQQVFRMSRFEELSYKEIAGKLSISVKSVEKHMGIALLRLRESLKEYLIQFLLFLLLNFF